MPNKIAQKLVSAVAQTPSALRKAQAAQSRSGLKKQYLSARQNVFAGLTVETTRRAHAARLTREYALMGALAGRTLGAYAVTGLLDHLVGTTGYSGHTYSGFLGDTNSGLPKLGEEAASFVGWHIGYAVATVKTLRSAARYGADSSEGSLAIAQRQLIALTTADLMRQGVRSALLMPIYAIQASVMLSKYTIAFVGAAVGVTMGLPFLIQALCVPTKMRSQNASFAQQMMTAVFGPESFSSSSLDDFDPHLVNTDRSRAQNYTRYLIKRTGWQLGDKLGVALDATEQLLYGIPKGVGKTEMRVVRRRVIRMMGVKTTASFLEPCVLGTYGLFKLVTEGASLVGTLAGFIFCPQSTQEQNLYASAMPGAFPVAI